METRRLLLLVFVGLLALPPRGLLWGKFPMASADRTGTASVPNTNAIDMQLFRSRAGIVRATSASSGSASLTYEDFWLRPTAAIGSGD
jgi:hypothetical protein